MERSTSGIASDSYPSDYRGIQELVNVLVLQLVPSTLVLVWSASLVCVSVPVGVFTCFLSLLSEAAMSAVSRRGISNSLYWEGSGLRSKPYSNVGSASFPLTSLVLRRSRGCNRPNRFLTRTLDTRERTIADRAPPGGEGEWEGWSVLARGNESSGGVPASRRRCLGGLVMRPGVARRSPSWRPMLLMGPLPLRRLFRAGPSSLARSLEGLAALAV